MPILSGKASVTGGSQHNKAIGNCVMDAPNKEFTLAGSLDELKAKGRLVLHGGHRPILVIYDRGRALGESKCGRQHQSIEPSMPTSATVCRSPMTP
jgi:hypothetical protein